MALEEMLTEAQFAKRFEKCLRTVQRWRKARTGPSHVKVGNTVFYRVDAINAWLQAGGTH